MPDWVEKPKRAAARVYKPTEIKPNQPSRKVADAWEIYRCVPEVHYVVTQQARLMSRLDWDIVVSGNDIEPEPAAEFLREAFAGHMSDLARLAMIHLQVAGAYWLVRMDEKWKVLPDPLRDKQRRQVLDEAEVMVRVWTPDPVDQDDPDSPILASLDISRELILARAQARAQARNRTAQLGFLLYPRDGVDDADQFEKDISEVMVAPLADEHSASVAVPNMVGFDSEFIDKIRHLDIAGDRDDDLTKRIERLVRQLAVALDAPPEMLLGMGEANHWSGWLIQEDNWLGHTEPYAQAIGEGFALALSRLAEEDEGDLQITPDPGPLLKRRPTISDALAANAQGLVGPEWTRLQLGADEDDAPPAAPELDRAVTLAIDLAKSAPTLAQDPGLDVLAQQIAGMLAGESAPALNDAIASTEPEQPAVAAAQRTPDVDELIRIDEMCLESLIDAVDLAVQRALTKVGSKLRSMSQRDKSLTLPKGPPAEIALRADTSTVPNLDVTVASAVAELNAQVRKVIGRAYAKVRDAGVPLAEDPRDVDDAVALFNVAAAAVAATALDGSATTALTWQAAVAVRGVAGGNGDPRPVITAAVNLSLSGLALGGRSLGVIRDVFELVADKWQWEHVGGSGNDHPEHVALDGEILDAEYVLKDGINWFPGDHDGCRCRLRPVLRKVA